MLLPTRRTGGEEGGALGQSRGLRIVTRDTHHVNVGLKDDMQ